MPFDDVGMSGEGTLKEYFSHETMPVELPGVDLPADFLADLDERDSALDRLQLQLFTEFSGLGENEVMQVFWPDYESDPYFQMFEDDDEAEKAIKASREALFAKKDQPGLVLIGIQPDDPILALFKDGEPVAAFYASYRGVYQAGGYVASDRVVDHRIKTDRHYFAHNMFAAEELPQNEWIEDYEAVCSQIARDFLLGLRSY